MSPFLITRRRVAACVRGGVRLLFLISTTLRRKPGRFFNIFDVVGAEFVAGEDADLSILEEHSVVAGVGTIGLFACVASDRVEVPVCVDGVVSANAC